jgi:hypothetical protein
MEGQHLLAAQLLLTEGSRAHFQVVLQQQDIICNLERL